MTHEGHLACKNLLFLFKKNYSFIDAAQSIEAAEIPAKQKMKVEPVCNVLPLCVLSCGLS